MEYNFTIIASCIDFFNNFLHAISFIYSREMLHEALHKTVFCTYLYNSSNILESLDS